jgi:hypothetical protein
MILILFLHSLISSLPHAQSVRLGSNEFASDDNRKRSKHARKIVNMRLSHLKEIILLTYSVTD